MSSCTELVNFFISFRKRLKNQTQKHFGKIKIFNLNRFQLVLFKMFLNVFIIIVFKVNNIELIKDTRPLLHYSYFFYFNEITDLFDFSNDNKMKILILNKTLIIGKRIKY